MDWSAAGDTQTNHPDPNQRAICVRFVSDRGSITQNTVKLGSSALIEGKNVSSNLHTYTGKGLINLTRVLHHRVDLIKTELV